MTVELAPIKIQLDELVEKIARIPNSEKELMAMNAVQGRLLRTVDCLVLGQEGKLTHKMLGLALDVPQREDFEENEERVPL